MYLKTLGSLALENCNFSRPKPLLLLAYLAVEGTKDKRHLHELFWPGAEDPANSLRVLSKLLRDVSPSLLTSDERTLSTQVGSDIAALQNALTQQDIEEAAKLYTGSFMAEFSLPHCGAELEEWVYSTREYLAARVRAAFIQVAESEAARGEFAGASGWAEKAYGLSEDHPEPEELERLYPLLVAGQSSLSGEARKQAREYGLDLNLSLQQARNKYFSAIPEGSPAVQAIRNNLPRSKTTFIGRDPELVELGQLISKPEAQLITLLGPGGIGKTRLALQLANQQLQEDNFTDGIYFVALEALSEPTQIPQALAQTLGLKVKDDPLDALKTQIGSKQILLVLDNFEHLVEGALLVSELLEACPHLSLVVTSRERLNLEEEYVLGLEGLPLPTDDKPDLATVEYNDATRLFVQRAKRTRLDFALTSEALPHVMAICRLVEGSPLGIELAAAWLRSLRIEDVARELSRNTGLLKTASRNINQRHQSIQATFEYSWKLLKYKEQLTLARLSVFSGGFTHEASGAVADSNLAQLSALVDKSLLRISPEGRYNFHPLLHQFASQKLAELPEENEQTRAKHGHYFLTLVDASAKAGVQVQIRSCKDEYENLLRALAWSGESNQALMGLRLGHVLGYYWRTQGYPSEGQQWLARILSHPGATPPSEARFEVLLEASSIASHLRNSAQAFAYGREALGISQVLGQETLKARALTLLANTAYLQTDYQGAQQYAEEALVLARRLGLDELVANTLNNLGAMAGEFGQNDQCRILIEEGLGLWRKLGRWEHVGYGLSNLGYLALLMGNLLEARTYLEEALSIALELPELNLVCYAQSHLSVVLQDLGELAPARVLAGKALEYRWKQKDKADLCYVLEGFASLSVLQRDARRAVHLWGVAERLRQETQAPVLPLWKARSELYIGRAKGQLDEEGFSAAWQEGRTMELQEAVRYALETTEVVVS